MVILSSFHIPGESPSTPNAREHWAETAKRAKATKAKARLVGRALQERMPTLLVVELVRIGARVLDSDNLQGALKSHRDAVAGLLGVDDGSKLVRYDYAQRVAREGEAHGVTVHVMQVGDR